MHDGVDPFRTSMHRSVCRPTIALVPSSQQAMRGWRSRIRMKAGPRAIAARTACPGDIRAGIHFGIALPPSGATGHENRRQLLLPLKE